jgi:hypothetical protein
MKNISLWISKIFKMNFGMLIKFEENLSAFITQFTLLYGWLTVEFF